MKINIIIDKHEYFFIEKILFMSRLLTLKIEQNRNLHFFFFNNLQTINSYIKVKVTIFFLLIQDILNLNEIKSKNF